MGCSAACTILHSCRALRCLTGTPSYTSHVLQLTLSGPAELGAVRAAATAAIQHSKQHMQQTLSQGASALPEPGLEPGPLQGKRSSSDVQALSVMARELSVTDPPSVRASSDHDDAHDDTKVAAGIIRPHNHKHTLGGMVSAEQRCPPHGIKVLSQLPRLSAHQTSAAGPLWLMASCQHMQGQGYLPMLAALWAAVHS